MSDKILQMFFDIGRWKKAIEKGVLKDIRKDQLIRLTDEHTRMAMADAMIRGKYEIAPPHTAQIPKENICNILSDMVRMFFVIFPDNTVQSVGGYNFLSAGSPSSPG